MLLAAKLRKPVADLSDADVASFVTDFVKFCKESNQPVEKRTVTRWLEKQNSIIYEPNRVRVVGYFQRDLPLFSDVLLGLDLAEFQKQVESGTVTGSRSVSIDLWVPLGFFGPEDKAFLCGVYELFHYSFSNDGQISIDLLVVTAEGESATRLNLEIFAEPLNPGGPHELFVGHFYTYGRTLLGLPVLKSDDTRVARVRRFEFPVEDVTRTREAMVKIGIVSGNSVQLHGPVSAKCLISKISNNPMAASRYLNIVKRYSPHTLYDPYVEAIRNDVRRHPDRTSDQDDYVLCIQSTRKPRVRPRSSNPALVDDPDDPHSAD